MRTRPIALALSTFLLGGLLTAFALGPRTGRTGRTEGGEVTCFEPGGFTLEKTVDVPLDPTAAFEAFTGDVTPWWDHHFAEEPHALVIEPRVGGAFVERFDDSGAGVEHARVTFVQPGQRLVLRGPFGFHGKALDLVHSFEFREHDDGTRLTLELNGSGQMTDSDLEALDRVWDHFLGNYVAHAASPAKGSGAKAGAEAPGER